MKAGQVASLQAAVAVEQSLIGDAVCTALRSRGFIPRRVPWARDDAPLPRSGGRFDVGLLVCELDRWQRVRATGVMLRSLPIPWVVLTGAPAGPLWGAAYDQGAAAVIPSSTPLDAVVTALTTVARGVSVVPEAERDRLREEWRLLRESRAELQARAESLTPREREVLLLLYEGAPILEIATLLDVSASTVRSQMKAIRHKLGVTSQLAAVAAFGALTERAPPGATPGPPRVRS